MKVLVCRGQFGRDPLESGETDGRIVQLLFIKVNGELCDRSLVWEDTPKNREVYETHRQAWLRWKESEPNMYQALNNMVRPKG